MSTALHNKATPSPQKREREATAKTRETDRQKPPPTTAHNNKEEAEISRAIVLSLEEEAITKKRQGKKRVNSATHDPKQNDSNKGPTAKSNSSDEEDSGELKMTNADTRETPTAHRGPTPEVASSTSLTDATVQTAAQPTANNNAATSVEQEENTEHTTVKQHQRQPRQPQTPA